MLTALPKIHLWAAALFMALAVLLSTQPASALGCLPTVSHEKCTCPSSIGASSATVTASGYTPISGLMLQINHFVDKLGQNLYDEIITSTFYTNGITALFTLYIVMFGFYVLLGFENFTFMNVFMKIFKLGAVFWLVTPGGWDVFQAIIGTFFWGSLVEIIEAMTSVTATTLGSSAGFDPARMAAPLSMFDEVIVQVTSPHYWATVMGTFVTGSIGKVMTVFLLISTMTLFAAIGAAVFKYVKGMIGLWFLFAVGPIFLAASLFKNTTPLFEGWLEKMLGFTLDVILMFVFLPFFLTLAAAALDPILSVSWCKIHLWNWIYSIDATSFKYWHPVEIPGIGILDNQGENKWSSEGYDNNGTFIQFPIGFTDVFFYYLTAHIAWKYNTFVTLMATTLSSSGMRLGSTVADAQQYLKSKGLAPGNPIAAVKNAFSR